MVKSLLEKTIYENDLISKYLKKLNLSPVNESILLKDSKREY